MRGKPLAARQHALLGFLYGAALSGLMLWGESSLGRNGTATMVLVLVGFIPLLFAGLAGVYRDEFWERALFKNRETRRRMLGWLLGIILILVLLRFLR